MVENELILPTNEPIEPADGDAAPAWEMVAEGRYRPRRIKGSLRGRELG